LADQILSNYNDFLREKIKLARRMGLDMSLAQIAPGLKPAMQEAA
jgi:hypothetical protein